jgi:Protein of unknown function (DUF1553)/Protein of unknown function (DUF1549)/Planctomycete cytochrome C
MKVISSILFALPLAAFAQAPDFTREVRPILSRYCFKCHGPDDKTRKGELRLDIRDEALKPAESGARAIVPGKVGESELLKRIFHEDPEEAMPPRSAKQILSPLQKETLKRWIASGAEYREHWSFIAPARPKPPSGTPHPVDAFIAAKLEQHGLVMSPPADAAALCRRLYLDLVGLPPTPGELDAFTASAAVDRPAAITKLADTLLASPRYGERWARKWLDLARYADTNGYEKDRDRSIWPYRDWVINAMNADMPFDRFTIEQIAGDLLPDATLQQRVATGFHRNTMLNEEGGIDPLEFRFAAMVDRVATTGTTWLGLTIGCAQCHTHKFDPIQHSEYFKLFAFLNNADEPELDLPPPDAPEQAKARAARAAGLESKWPIEAGAIKWQTPRPTVAAASGEKPKLLDDGSALFAGLGPERDRYTITFDASGAADHLRIEALADPALPSKGPGRVAHGNFVLSEATVTAQPSSGGAPVPVKLRAIEASAEQAAFPVSAAVDGSTAGGWAVDEGGKSLNRNQSATFAFDRAVEFPGGTRFSVTLDQSYGGKHTIGRPRISVGATNVAGAPVAARRREIVDARFASWLAQERAKAVNWDAVRPASAKSNSPLLTVQPDASVFCSGDITKSDTYELKFTGLPQGVTAIRLEALPDERLPAHGPGMTYYEGPKGDFFLGEFSASVEGTRVKFAATTQSHAKNNFGASPATAKMATDGDLQTGWSCADRPGEAHEAVFVLADPLKSPALEIKMTFGRHYACSLGRFRISFTTKPGGAVAREMPDEIGKLLAKADAQLTADERAMLRGHFLLAAPELASQAKEIRELRKPMKFTTTLVMRERPPENPRPTFIHNRGEFLQPTERVEAGVPAVLPPLPKDAPPNRLTFARWLVSRENPLTARVAVNRAWAAFFGRGLVRTTEDFGLQGEAPTHPDLLDWLAVEFMEAGWSQKKLHRLIVTSAAYQQSSRVPPNAPAKDPENRWLSHFPRSRLDAEIIRDSALRAGGLLVDKLGGPSVRPPQPDGVTEVAYGSPKWNADTGDARHRRSLYTYAKRTAPFALYNTFDAPTGEACVARRDMSNTPLQALTLLNDRVFIEASQALGKTIAASDDAGRLREAWRRVLSREPSAAESAALLGFVAAQRERFERKELDAAVMAGEPAGATPERAAWTALVRAMLNVDEFVTKP